MPLKERKKQKIVRKNSRFFYFYAIIIFASFSLINLFFSLYDGFTNERIVLLLLNMWFIFYTINIVTYNLKRKSERTNAIESIPLKLKL
jgi:hypothetical protein